MSAEPLTRCIWADESDLMRVYHDTEWWETQCTTVSDPNNKATIGVVPGRGTHLHFGQRELR